MKNFLFLLLLLVSNVAIAGSYNTGHGAVDQADYTTVSNGTKTLSATANQVQFFSTGNNGDFHILKLPDATDLPNDWWLDVYNNSPGFVTVRDNGNNNIASVNSGRIGKFHLQSHGTTNGTWAFNTPAAVADVITDHGQLTGLGDDDHPQYHNDARGDARYFTKSQHISTSAGTADAGKPVVLDGNGKFDISMIPPGGAGDVSGPAGATDLAVALFDGTTGKLLKEGGPTVDATGNMTAIGFTGPLNGNATTAGALDHTPAACSSGDFASAIAADGTLTCGTPSASGDVSSNTSSSVDGEVALFSGMGGKTIKRATGSGLAKLTSGVLGTATAGTDYVAATSGSAIQKANGSGGLTSATSGTDYAPATSGSSILKGNGSGGFSSAVSGTDYAPATSGTSLLKGNGSGGFSSASSGTDYAPATSGSLPLFGNGSGGFTNGSITGNTTKVATSTGSLTSGNCAKWDANGNIIDAGTTCGASATALVGNNWGDEAVTVTPSAGFGTVTNKVVKARRVGDSVEVQVLFTAGTLAHSSAYIDIGSTWTIDTAKIALVGSAARTNLGESISIAPNTTFNFYNGSLGWYQTLFYDGSTATRLYFGYGGASNAITAAYCDDLNVNNGNFSLKFSYPVSGWTAN